MPQTLKVLGIKICRMYQESLGESSISIHWSEAIPKCPSKKVTNGEKQGDQLPEIFKAGLEKIIFNLKAQNPEIITVIQLVLAIFSLYLVKYLYINKSYFVPDCEGNNSFSTNFYPI